MTRLIPRELIKHLEWVPGQQPPKQEPPVPVSIPQNSSQYSLDDILHGRTFYDGKLPVALRQALEYAGREGIVATMPEFIAAKIKADKSHNFWKEWYAVHTEENIGHDKNGRFYQKNEPVLVLVNGGGILTPERIEQAYSEDLINGSAKYRDDEFDALLEGKLPDGTAISLYKLEEIQRGVSNLLHRFGVVMPYSIAQETKSGLHKKKEFLENPLVIARVGGSENLEAYYEKAKDKDGDVGSWHSLNGRDASQPQGRVLFVGYDCGGLGGSYYLNDIGRFVGVAPEAPRARK